MSRIMSKAKAARMVHRGIERIAEALFGLWSFDPWREVKLIWDSDKRVNLLKWPRQAFATEALQMYD